MAIPPSPHRSELERARPGRSRFPLAKPLIIADIRWSLLRGCRLGRSRSLN